MKVQFESITSGKNPEINKEKADKKTTTSEVGNTVNEVKIKAANTIKSVPKERDTKNERFQCTGQEDVL